MKPPRWLVPFGLAALLGWWVSRPSGPAFVRLPGGGYPAPAWRMPDLSGAMIASTNLAGSLVVLNFWATWCPPCRRELPELEAFHRRNSNRGVVVVGAATDAEGAATVGPFARRHELTYPMLLADPAVQESFAVVSLPTTVIIGRDGRVSARYLGSLTGEELDRAIAPLLADPAPVMELEDSRNPSPAPAPPAPPGPAAADGRAPPAAPPVPRPSAKTPRSPDDPHAAGNAQGAVSPTR